MTATGWSFAFGPNRAKDSKPRKEIAPVERFQRPGSAAAQKAAQRGTQAPCRKRRVQQGEPKANYRQKSRCVIKQLRRQQQDCLPGLFLYPLQPCDRINRIVREIPDMRVNYMRTKKVVVLPYDAAWQSAFKKIKGEIEEAIGDLIIGIEHVGSTSVEGLSAKPCIDIDVIIKDHSAFTAVVNGLKAIGYIYEGDLGIKDREAFKYSGKEHLQMHHLYVCPKYSEELHRHITFRDFLRSNPKAVEKYSFIKTKAAELFPNDVDGYIAYKSPCIEELYKECGLK